MLEENPERTVSRDSYAQQDGYVKRCRRLQAAIKIENPVGTRLQELLVGGAAITDARRYRAAFLITRPYPNARDATSSASTRDRSRRSSHICRICRP